MDKNSKNHHLGVNKLGKSIRKSRLHQTSFQKGQSLPPPLPPQPQVYNISKSDFRSIVQQLTGSPSRDAAVGNPHVPVRLPQQKPPSSRLMKIRPPPLTPIARPHPPSYQYPVSNPNPNANPNPNLNPNPAFHPRPLPSPTTAWADSPVSAYMRYLQSSILSTDGSRQTPAQGLLPSPHLSTASGAPFISLRGNPPSGAVLLPSPRSQFPLPSPRSQIPLPSPNSLLPLPSPSSFFNLLSPKSLYPLLSPGFQYQLPLTPNFSFSPIPQSGILGPAPGSQPPLSPSLLFPPSPSGFQPLLSPKWREM